ncbi:MAG: DUF4279 domain-containing protein [Phycisphaerales bacterium]|nr:DUF4279 domain-containing protein [Phycisphaerales bacterium]
MIECTLWIDIVSTHYTAQALKSSIGIPPTELHSVGEPREGSAEVYGHSLWRYEVSCNAEETIDCAIGRLSASLGPSIQEIRDICDGMTTARIVVGVFFSTAYISLALSRESLQKLEAMGLPFEVVCYPSCS